MMSDFFKRIFGGSRSSDKIDDPEDPRLLKIHYERLIQEDIAKLTGICEMALLDGHVSEEEAKTIFVWLQNNARCLDTWPANILYHRLRLMLADGTLDSDEQKDLLSIIMTVGRPRKTDGDIAPSLPVDDPAPDILFNSKNFCFTGVFDYGARHECIAAITSRGGLSLKGVTKKLNYLIVGSVGSEVWKHTSFGLKIAKAATYRDEGVPIAIVEESHWTKHLN
jgi:NAD-dependent DNA ligase